MLDVLIVPTPEQLDFELEPDVIFPVPVVRLGLGDDISIESLLLLLLLLSR